MSNQLAEASRQNKQRGETITLVLSEKLRFFGITRNMKVFFGSVSEGFDRSLPDLNRFRSVFSNFLAFRISRADLPCYRLQKILTNHPEVAQRKQRLKSRGVLGQGTVRNLDEVELTHDDSMRILNLRPISGFDFLCCVTKLFTSVSRFNTGRLPDIITICQFT